jgi:hypothetical protein
MASLADKLVPPYYAAIIENQPHMDMNEPANTGDRLVTLAVRRPGFLGLETARSGDGRPVTVAYWRDLIDVEGWQSESGTIGAQSYPLEVCHIASNDDQSVQTLFMHADGEQAVLQR